MERIPSKSIYLNTSMDRQVFKDISHLTERQKIALALAHALEDNHSEYRVQELTRRLMRFSILGLDDNEIFYDEIE